MFGDTLPEQMRQTAYHYIKARLERTDNHVKFNPDDVYVVWFTKTLQHYKGLVSTTLPDGAYYELTHNGDTGETYVDHYVKVNNEAIPDADRPKKEG